MIMFQVFICQLFSGRCHLKSLRLDLSEEITDGKIHRCLTSEFHYTFNFTQYQRSSFCLTLHRLHIRLKYACFLENLLEHVPNLEQLTVQFHTSLIFDLLCRSNVERLKQSYENWFSKVRKRTEK